MHQIVKVVVFTCAIVLATGSAALAQKGNLPKGRPFQILQDAIVSVEANVDAAIANLQTQLAALTGRVDVVEQRNAVQDQLIGVLQGAALSLQQRMTSAEFDIATLNSWRQLQDPLLLQLSQRVSQLEGTASSQSNALTQLVTLFNAQQNHLNAVQGNLNFLNGLSANLQNQITGLQAQINSTTAVNDAQTNQLIGLFQLHGQVQGQVNALVSSLSALNTAYSQTRDQLAVGCPQGQSIRQVLPNTPAVCEVDAGQHTAWTTMSASSTVGPLSFGAVAVSCPPAPPGQPGFLATGGGHTMSTQLTLFSSAPVGSGASWQVVVFNPTTLATPLGFGVTVNCIRQVIP